MANKRADNIRRVTITLDADLLKELEAACEKSGQNRLEVIREAIAAQLARNAKTPKKDH